MSSLLQFQGKTGTKEVRLEFVKSYLPWEECRQFCKPQEGESVPCCICGGTHPQVYIAWRKPKGMFGHWVVFEYNKEEHVPDLSIPIEIDTLPHDAKPLPADENSHCWHS